MRKDKETHDEAADEVGEPAAMGGQVLADARRRLKFKVADIAKELHLDEFKVRAIESNDFEPIGPPVFVRGHLRKYAQLVEVSEQDMMADYERLHTESNAPLIVHKRPRQRRELSPGPWVAAVVAALAVGVAYWWFVVVVPSRATQEPSAPLFVEPEITDDVTERPAESLDTPDSADDNQTDAPAAESEPDASPPPPAQIAGEVRLSISFSGDSWTEITDATGRRLFFELGSAGRSVEVAGAPPLNVLFGNADSVSMTVNGAHFTIPDESRRGRTARLTINEP